MRSTIVITGSASGIGAGAAEWLRNAGHRVIGVDLRDADVVADLGTGQGRQQLATGVTQLAADGIDAVIACAGVGRADPATTVSVNYFGAVATLEGLLPALHQRPRARAVLVASTAALMPDDAEVVDACLAGDESRARRLAANQPALAYASSKRALALWMRRTAIEARWAGSGVALNGIGPGTTRTPMTAALIASDEGRAMLDRVTPCVTGRYGETADTAELLAFLATMATGQIIGQMVFVDGGADAVLRPAAI